MDVIEKQLDYLNETMKDTAAGANSFLLKYHFGGLVAVLALLNLDLVLLDEMQLTSEQDRVLLWIAVAAALILSFVYFYFVLKHYHRFSKSHRKLKYKYELTLHFAFIKGRISDLQYYMEQKITVKVEGEDKPIERAELKNYEFNFFADYLLKHHRFRFQEINKQDSHYIWIAMLVIILTLGIRLFFVFMGADAETVNPADFNPFQ